jgi:Integrase core domain
VWSCLAASTRINRLSHINRVTGEPVRRYEHPEPGDLLHVDVKKLGNIPDGGGWRYVGRAQGRRHRAATPGKPRNAHRNPKMGTAFVHTVLDDHSRVAYAEIHDDETAATAAAVLRRAVAWSATRNVTVTRVLSDNGSAYRSHLWRNTCTELGITPKRTRPYRPQTNGGIERFHRTLADGWAFRRLYTSESQRRKALPSWIHEYNHHRPHTAIGGHPPISRLTNLSGQYTWYTRERPLSARPAGAYRWRCGVLALTVSAAHTVLAEADSRASAREAPVGQGGLTTGGGLLAPRTASRTALP